MRKTFCDVCESQLRDDARPLGRSVLHEVLQLSGKQFTVNVDIESNGDAVEHLCRDCQSGLMALLDTRPKAAREEWIERSTRT
jgi:hypothetical protein